MTFENFLEDMGIKPEGMTLGRIDNDKGYSPSNCQWESQKTQARNRSSNLLLSFRGITKCLQEWADEVGIARDALGHRIRTGWSVERALTTPAKKQNNSRGNWVVSPKQSWFVDDAGERQTTWTY